MAERPERVTLLERFRAWRLERAELELADARHYKANWVDGWNKSPSQRQRAKQDIERWEKRVRKLGGDVDA